jgi:hypothetical protein
VEFSYEERIDKEKLVFYANTNQSVHSKFIIKFTRRYSPEAHCYLACREWAPRLRHCSPLPGMDRDFHGYLKLPRYTPLYGMTLSDNEKAKVRLKARKIVEKLRAGGFVHGDVRDTNILIDRKSLADTKST